MWPLGSHCLVTFRNSGDIFSSAEYGRVTSAIKELANVWTRHANVFFDFDDNAPYAGMIRVDFVPGKGHYSYVGKDSAFAHYSSATTNFDPDEINIRTLDEDPDRFRQVVLHAFGHALGFIHEHSQPNAKIQWNRPEVYKFYADAYDWSERRTEDEVLKRYETWSKGNPYSMDYDRDSVMHYDVSEKYTLNGARITGGKDLSHSDKRLIDECYPLPASGGVGTFQIMAEVLPSTPGMHEVLIAPDVFRSNFHIRELLFGVNRIDITSENSTLSSGFDARPPHDPEKPKILVRVPPPAALCPPHYGGSWIALTSPRSDLQCGHENVSFFYKEDTEEDDYDPQTQTVKVKFSTPYPRDQIPRVVAWFNSIESRQSSRRGHNLEVLVTDIDSDSFRLNLTVASQSTCHLGITWLSYLSTRTDVVSGTVVFENERGREEKTLSNLVDFPGRTFPESPKVFAAFSAINTRKGNGYVSVDVPEDTVMTSRMTLNTYASTGKTLRKATVTYVAIDPENKESQPRLRDMLDDLMMITASREVRATTAM